VEETFVICGQLAGGALLGAGLQESVKGTSIMAASQTVV